MEVNKHFSEIINNYIKLDQFGKKRNTLLCILLLVSKIIVAYLSLKNAWLPPIFILEFNIPCKGLLFLQSCINRAKITQVIF